MPGKTTINYKEIKKLYYPTDIDIINNKNR